VLPHLPFAFAENLQAGAVDDDINRPLMPAHIERNPQLRRALSITAHD